jgi:alkylhydroperoxidase family enzyme
MPIDDRHAALTQTMITTVLTRAGVIPSQLRTQIEAYVAQRSEASSEEALSPTLSGYIDTVALHAYKVTDEDISALLKAGYSEDGIFEITVSAALGAGMMRLQRGLEALKGERYASETT